MTCVLFTLHNTPLIFHLYFSNPCHGVITGRTWGGIMGEQAIADSVNEAYSKSVASWVASIISCAFGSLMLLLLTLRHICRGLHLGSCVGLVGYDVAKSWRSAKEYITSPSDQLFLSKDAILISRRSTSTGVRVMSDLRLCGRRYPRGRIQRKCRCKPRGVLCFSVGLMVLPCCRRIAW